MRIRRGFYEVGFFVIVVMEDLGLCENLKGFWRVCCGVCVGVLYFLKVRKVRFSFFECN